MQIQILRPMLTLNQNHRFVVRHNGIVDFLTLLFANVTTHLRQNFKGVENIIAQCRYKRHNQCIFCGLFCKKIIFKHRNTLCNLSYLVFEIHNQTILWGKRN